MTHHALLLNVGDERLRGEPKERSRLGAEDDAEDSFEGDVSQDVRV